MMYVERCDRSGRIVERMGPFEFDSAECRRAVMVQMHIATLHNRSRYPDDPGFQYVQEVDQCQPTA